jgi:hypothetical protein
MSNSWTCLMVEKGPGIISDDVRAELTIVACAMSKGRVERQKVNGNYCGGVMTSEWSSHSIGGRSGILFRAQLDGHDGEDYKVNFLLSEDDLKRGVKKLEKRLKENDLGKGNWISGEGKIPIPELYDFYDLRKRNVH